MNDSNLIRLDELRRKAKLASSGRGSDGGGMLEQRVAALEADMREVKNTLGRIEALMRGFDDRLRRVEVDVADLKGKVSQLPTAWASLTGATGPILATFGFAFALVRFGLPR